MDYSMAFNSQDPFLPFKVDNTLLYFRGQGLKQYRKTEYLLHAFNNAIFFLYSKVTVVNGLVNVRPFFSYLYVYFSHT